MPKKRDKSSRELFVDPSGQLRLVDKSAEQVATEEAEVECLGLRFPSEEARRAHFTELLRAKLKAPEFRKTPGFPKGTDEDILRLSDPPWYTACPNPFLTDFVRVYGKPFDPKERYEREPMAVDVSVGKTDPLYKAHGYHTKVPHLAIVPSILHYTKPGDIVLDGFCGSGMTGVAAQWCGTAPASYRKELEAQWQKAGRGKPAWGARRAILGDLSPAATFITAGYNIPFDVDAFAAAAEQLLNEVEAEIGWMYETLHTDGKTKGRISYTVWSEVFTCPECSKDVNFLEEALNKKTRQVRDSFPCPHCGVELTKERLESSFTTSVDPATKASWKRIQLVPMFMEYVSAGKKREKPLQKQDFQVLQRIEALPCPSVVPTQPLPIEQMYHGSRLAPKGFTRIHHLFLPRARAALAALWLRAVAEADTRQRNALLFLVEQGIWGMSVLNRYSPTHYSQVNRALSGVYYVASQVSECSPWYNLGGRLGRLAKAFAAAPARAGSSGTTTGDCARIPIPSSSIDYIFTDPPFGENIPYADLNLLVEAWHRVLTDVGVEAIVDEPKSKGLHEYQQLMRACFAEYHRVLKPGRWMTVVFSNSSNAIWRCIQEAIGTAGFVVADVRTLDKQQGSYRQVTSSAVKQDLVISAYKPPVALAERFNLASASSEGAWAFITQHLEHVPVFVGASEEAEVVSERTPQMLHDRMVAFHVQHGLAVPLSLPDILAGLAARYPERDGMYFLPEQVAEYDKRRAKVDALRQLNLFVTDESSAIQWLRRELQLKPQSFQDLSPAFMKEVQGWAQHEQTIELKELLRQNFLCYEGDGPVPGQIHGYLSSNFKDLRKLQKDDRRLVGEARDRWYVPEPGRMSDLEELRQRALLKEFESYRTSRERILKQFRTEAVRAGFKAAYDEGDYDMIVAVAQKLPESVLQEDEKLLMYFDVATMRLGKD